MVKIFDYLFSFPDMWIVSYQRICVGSDGQLFHDKRIIDVPEVINCVRGPYAYRLISIIYCTKEDGYPYLFSLTTRQEFYKGWITCHGTNPVNVSEHYDSENAFIMIYNRQ